MCWTDVSEEVEERERDFTAPGPAAAGRSLGTIWGSVLRSARPDEVKAGEDGSSFPSACKVRAFVPPPGGSSNFWV